MWPFKKLEKPFMIKMLKADPRYWHTKYIGCVFEVRHSLNPADEMLDFLYTLTNSRHNKKILHKDEIWRLRYQNPWGYRLSVNAEDAEVFKDTPTP